jgi:hypothetical protein
MAGVTCVAAHVAANPSRSITLTMSCAIARLA